MAVDFSKNKRVTAENVSGNLPSYKLECLILDVRGPEEYRKGHIPGAVNIPLDSLKMRVGELKKGKKVLAVCLSGGKASKAAAFLEKKGFKVKSMAGGMSDWEGPLEH